MYLRGLGAGVLAAAMLNPIAAAACNQNNPETRPGSTAGAPATGPRLPKGLVCPMFCEPGKIYAQQTPCPVCEMALVPIDEMPYEVALVPVETPGREKPARPGPATTSFTPRFTDPIGTQTTAPSPGVTIDPRAVIVRTDLSWGEVVTPAFEAGVLRLQTPGPGRYALLGQLTFAPSLERGPQPYAARFQPSEAAPPADQRLSPPAVQSLQNIALPPYRAEIHTAQTYNTASKAYDLTVRLVWTRDTRTGDAAPATLSIDRDSKDPAAWTLFVVPATDLSALVIASPVSPEAGQDAAANPTTTGGADTEGGHHAAEGHGNEQRYALSVPAPGLYRAFVRPAFGPGNPAPADASTLVFTLQVTPARPPTGTGKPR